MIELKIPEEDKTDMCEMYSDELKKNLSWKIFTTATAISSKYQLSVEKRPLKRN
ncbi:hypothetical protein [Enterococcus hirae]|uniref:hypothetical protein n=1 Tax=Enterococcus hirae TaxID=1354 RepID=UPI0030D30F27